VNQTIRLGKILITYIPKWQHILNLTRSQSVLAGLSGGRLTSAVTNCQASFCLESILAPPEVINYASHFTKAKSSLQLAGSNSQSNSFGTG